MKDGNTPKRRVSEDGRPCCGSRQLASEEQDACGQARAWLLLLNEPFTEPIVLPKKEKRVRVRPQTVRVLDWKPLTVFPNPSLGPVSIMYEVPGAVADAQVRVMDALGKLMYQGRLIGKGIVELNLPKPAAGLHIVGLYFDGHLVATEKLQVTR